MVMKKIPGADSVNMVYDQWDRSGIDSRRKYESRGISGLFNKYDKLKQAG